MRGLAEHHAAALVRAQLLRPPRGIEESVVERVIIRVAPSSPLATIAGRAATGPSWLWLWPITRWTPGARRRLHHRRAVRERHGHRLLDQRMLAAGGAAASTWAAWYWCGVAM